jgi:hypothetical protein
MTHLEDRIHTYLDAIPPAIAGQGGDTQTYKGSLPPGQWPRSAARAGPALDACIQREMPAALERSRTGAQGRKRLRRGPSETTRLPA